MKYELYWADWALFPHVAVRRFVVEALTNYQFYFLFVKSTKVITIVTDVELLVADPLGPP